jgi:SNF family Na+-dependent transporter
MKNLFKQIWNEFKVNCFDPIYIAVFAFCWIIGGDKKHFDDLFTFFIMILVGAVVFPVIMLITTFCMTFVHEEKRQIVKDYVKQKWFQFIQFCVKIITPVTRFVKDSVDKIFKRISVITIKIKSFFKVKGTHNEHE